MPVKTGTQDTGDYKISKQTVESMITGETTIIEVDNYKRVQKYLYEIGLKMNPRREFSTKKLSLTELRVTRVC